MGQRPGHACKLDGAIGQFTQSFIQEGCFSTQKFVEAYYRAVRKS